MEKSIPLLDLINLIFIVAVFVMAGGVAWVRWKSQTASENTDELSDLAKTRGHRIVDLEKANARLETLVHKLESRVENLQGQMEAIQRIKANEIALEVVRLLDEREGRTPTPGATK